MLTVLKAGLLTSVMDLGRPGYQRYGVNHGGAADRFAARVANTIVGNDERVALLEFAQLGPELQFDRDVLAAWCGGDFDARVGGGYFPRDKAVQLAAGERVWFGPARAGLRGWLAVAGGIDVPLALGSRSTYRRAGLGGFHGRRLQVGDALPLGEPGEWAQARLRGGKRVSAWSLRPETLAKAPPAGAVRALRGPEWEWFSADAQDELFSASWRVTKDADRMGVRLEGPALARREKREMISEAAPEGAVQVTPSGPIALLASRQTVGGYPRIACVASVDFGRLAQLAPGSTVRFEPVGLEDAHALLLERERNLMRARMALPRLAG